MANKRVILGILVILLVFGVMIVGCDSGSNEPDEVDLFWNEAKAMWNAGGSSEVNTLMNHYKSDHGLSGSIPNNPNSWNRANAEAVAVAYTSCSCFS